MASRPGSKKMHALQSDATTSITTPLRQQADAKKVEEDYKLFNVDRQGDSVPENLNPDENKDSKDLLESKTATPSQSNEEVGPSRRVSKKHTSERLKLIVRPDNTA